MDNTVNNYLCALCWGRLIDVHGHVQCARDASHEGFVTKHYVDQRIRQSKVDAMDAKINLHGIIHNKLDDKTEQDIMKELGF